MSGQFIRPEDRSPKYQALLAFYYEQRKWDGGNMSLASEKRATKALKTLGLTDAEIVDFFKQ